MKKRLQSLDAFHSIIYAAIAQLAERGLVIKRLLILTSIPALSPRKKSTLRLYTIGVKQSICCGYPAR